MAAIAAQSAPGPAARTAATPALPDRATLLREVGIAHGMLRGLQYNDATTTAQYQATGTQYIVGPTLALPAFITRLVYPPHPAT